jgi:hypothetical protein
MHFQSRPESLGCAESFRRCGTCDDLAGYGSGLRDGKGFKAILCDGADFARYHATRRFKAERSMTRFCRTIPGKPRSPLSWQTYRSA